MHIESRWKNYEWWIFNVSKIITLTLLYSTLARWHFISTREQSCNITIKNLYLFSLHPSAPCTDPRMQLSPLQSYSSVFVINRSVNEIFATSCTRLYTLTSECPRDARDRGWMLIRNPVKFPSLSLKPSWGVWTPKRGPLTNSDLEIKRK